MTVTEEVSPAELHDVEPGASRKRSAAADAGKLIVIAGAPSALLFGLFNWGQSIADERIAGLEGQVSFLSQQLDLAEEVASLTQQKELLNAEIRQLQQRMTDLQSEPDAPPPEPPPGLLGCDDGQVDINTAPEEQLLAIMHIGEVRAPEVVRQRPFETVADMERVPGIGPVYITDIIEQGIACVAN